MAERIKMMRARISRRKRLASSQCTGIANRKIRLMHSNRSTKSMGKQQCFEVSLQKICVLWFFVYRISFQTFYLLHSVCVCVCSAIFFDGSLSTIKRCAPQAAELKYPYLIVIIFANKHAKRRILREKKTVKNWGKNKEPNKSQRKSRRWWW